MCKDTKKVAKPETFNMKITHLPRLSIIKKRVVRIIAMRTTLTFYNW
ncbi:hypothetical protein HMPREF0658_1488 [Hoylesella marshii DSM 16973 = JCM 13450]|uniref:Uncharacterized protein n=1 Tax=Hoylesella marshii DSM 16973 = JCM 13450 TaxID=862515 RepID=E0NTI6_9BACT|nr:hypothetical protein HMPREF0658_1488 [Hoylesella marshii DSM 16973 = JCM 13450]